MHSGSAVKPFKRGLTMKATATRFVRRTTLSANEYRTNFRQVDRDAIELLTSSEARRVTHLMGTLYLTLIDAPPAYWERDGVLRFTGDDGEGRPQTAWRQLVRLLACGNTTAKKALDWMHAQGIIGYYAGKNGAGIRIFINRAAASIGRRAGQKNLHLVHTPDQVVHTPAAGTPSNDSFAVSEVIETDLNRRAPQNGARTRPLGKFSSVPPQSHSPTTRTPPKPETKPTDASPAVGALSITQIVERLTSEFEPCVREITARVAAQSASREVERMRQWFETKALPKAIRVAQRETYDLLRKHGRIESRNSMENTVLDSRHAGDHPLSSARRLRPHEIRETAEVCIALLETQGKSTDVTLSEISSEAGGWLLPEDAPLVREAARSLELLIHR